MMKLNDIFQSPALKVMLSLTGVLLAGAVGTSCTTVVLGKPLPCPVPTEATDAELQALPQDSAILKELGEYERYCDYIDALRGDL